MAVIQEYKCPCCGGTIEFDILSQKMKCPYCDTEFELEALEGYEQDLQMDAEDEMNWDTGEGHVWGAKESENMNIFVCETCGGEIIADANTAATDCPYCNNHVVLKGRLTGALKPDLVIPFKLDKKAAKAAYLNHLEGKKLLPPVFKDENHINEIKGVYVPFWLFDAEADANIRYKATKIRAWSDSNYDYTETSYFSVVRAGHLGFEGVPVDGASKMPDELMESIEPFDLSQAVDFKTAYLSGYLADKYDVDADHSIDRANHRIRVSTAEAFGNTVRGYASVQTESNSIQLKNAKTRYALLPVWVLNTTWNDQKYTFVMNGQTGKLVGDLPSDPSLTKKYFLKAGGITAAALMAIQFLMWFL